MIATTLLLQENAKKNLRMMTSLEEVLGKLSTLETDMKGVQVYQLSVSMVNLCL